MGLALLDLRAGEVVGGGLSVNVVDREHIARIIVRWAVLATFVAVFAAAFAPVPVASLLWNVVAAMLWSAIIVRPHEKAPTP
jgi:hypothetical protein